MSVTASAGRRALRALLAATVPTPRYYGWAIVGAGAAFGALSFPGQSFALALYVEAWVAELGLSRLEVSSLYATATLVAAAALPFLGRLADRLTARAFFLLVLVGLAGALALEAAAEGALVLGASLVALRLLGQGAVGLGTLTATVTWFRKYRGRALAFVALGYPLGELLAPAAVLSLQAWLGWRGSLLALAALYLALAPLFALVLRERRADEPLDGLPEPASAASTGSAGEEPRGALLTALRRPVFWGLLTISAAAPVLLTAFLFHQLFLLRAFGFGAPHAATLLMGFALGRLALTYGGGLLVDRLSPSRSMALANLFGPVSLVALPAAALAGPLAPVVAGALLGAWSGASTVVNGLVWPTYFGVDGIGALKGVVNASRNGLTALGPLLLAPLLDVTSATVSLTFMAALATLASAASLLLPAPAPLSERPA